MCVSLKLPALLCLVQSGTVVCCAVWHCCVWCSLRLPALLCVVQPEVAGTSVCGTVRGCRHCCVWCSRALLCEVSLKLPALLCVVQSEVADTVVCGAV